VTVNKERVQLLVDALRSGEFTQHSGALRGLVDSDGQRGYCCLGVATEVALRNGLVVEEVTDPNSVSGLKGQPWEQTYQVMCPAVGHWYGWAEGNPLLVGANSNEPRQDVASHWNDDFNFGFDVIADAFERTYITGHEATPVI